MQLYHWHGVLQDYTAGDIVVYADSLDEAQTLAKYRIKEHYFILTFSQDEDASLDDSDGYLSDIETIETVMPAIYDYPVALPFVGSA